jgi:hypothetical protein
MFAKGGMIQRVYGRLGLLYLLGFAIKKWPEYHQKLSFLKALSAMWKGRKHFIEKYRS